MQCHAHAWNLSKATLGNYMTFAHADVRSCTRGHHFPSQRRIARALANLSQTYRHAVRTYVFLTRPPHHHVMPPTEHIPAFWYDKTDLVIIDAMLTSSCEFRARSHAHSWLRAVLPANQLGGETWFTGIEERPQLLGQKLA